MNHPAFNIDVSSLLTLPASVYWKDTALRLQACNKTMCDAHELPDPAVVVNRRDDELGFVMASQYQANDAKTLQANCATVASEHIVNPGSQHFCISIKCPLYFNDDTLAGIIGISFNNTTLSFTQIKKYVRLLQQGVPHLQAQHHLSKREMECLWYLVEYGYSAKQISEQLYLSRRTIEHYIDNIKTKLNCHNRAQLIKKALELDIV